MAKGTQSFDTSLVEGFSYSAPTVTFYTASEGALLQSTIESPSFDYEAVVKAFC